MAPAGAPDGWRFGTAISGERCVMTAGTSEMPLWCVGSSAVETQYQPQAVLILGMDLGLSGWTTLTAMARRSSSLSVRCRLGESTTAGTARMQALCAQVRMAFA